VAERLLALGDALELAGYTEASAAAWDEACRDNSLLAVDLRPAGPADYWRGIALIRLGRKTEAEAAWQCLEDRADELADAPAAPDYFATSLPELLLFDTGTASSRLDLANSLRELAALGRAHGKEGANL
jgi:hypothetical protein